MNKILFVGNMESPYIEEVLCTIISPNERFIMSESSFQKLGDFNSHLKKQLQTWSWKSNSDLYVGFNEILHIFPYIYPDTIDLHKFHDLSNVFMNTKRTFANFRLGFGVQEELFDLYLTHLFSASGLVYFELSNSIQLLNPVNQIEFRKKSYGYLEFLSKNIFVLSNCKLVQRKYRISNLIPFFENFSREFEYAKIISFCEIVY